MKLRVKYTAQLRTAIERTEEVIELAGGSSLSSLFTHLAEQHPNGRPHLLNSRGQVHSSLLVVVNDSAVPTGNAASLQLQDGDVVLLLPPIAGG